MNDTDSASAYPRPQLRRAGWISLDGEWSFALETKAVYEEPHDVRWDRRIRVPFAPETVASGIHDPGFHEVCWYRRIFQPPALGPGHHLWLHFNAVDYHAKVWANGALVGSHEGGYTPFCVELTDLVDQGPITIVVRAFDDPHDLAKPRGKQDWQLEPHSIWYPRSTGIWQSVWLETVPDTWIDTLRWTPNLERWELGLEARINGARCEGARLRVRMRARNQPLADDSYEVFAGEVTRRIGFSDPGIDDYRNALLWSPHSPTLIDIDLDVLSPEGDLIDHVESYAGLRAIANEAQTILLNGRPYPMRLVLDQGYWPDTGMTPPDTHALRRDVELAKAMGFNGVRKHQKIEDPRYYYWADHLGLLVWTEMPSAYRFTVQTVERLTSEWLAVMRRDYSQPCVVAWVPFNESWGVPNLPDIEAQRHFVQGLYYLTRTLDSSRLVVGNDGWESASTDIIGIHDYDDDPERLRRRYQTHDEIPNLFRRERPGGRALVLEGHAHKGQPIMLSEFGGIACSDGGHWGYSTAADAEELGRRYTELLEVVRSLPALAGFCYTQFADTYQEANGLLDAHRRPKFPIEVIADATRGPRRSRMTDSPEAAPRAERDMPGDVHSMEAP